MRAASSAVGLGERGGGDPQQRWLDAQVGGHAVDDVHVALRARGELRVVGHHHDGGALLVDFLEQLHHPARHLRIEVAGRLVRQQQARAARERARDRGALLLAAGQLGRIVLHARAEADLRQRLLDALAALGGRHAAVAQRHVAVVEQVEVRDQVEALEDEADLAVAQLRARVVGQTAHVLAVEQVFAPGEGLQQARDVEEGGLARARGAGDRNELAVAHVQVERPQGVGLDEFGAVDLADLAHLEHGVSSLSLFFQLTIQLTTTRSASPNRSLPETTTRSPSCSPSTISTAPRLLAPVRIGRLTATSPSITQALTPPPCSRNGPRSTISTSRRVSSRIRADMRWFWRRPGGCASLKRRRAVTSPLTTSGDTAETSAAKG